MNATTDGAGERAHRAAHQEPDCSTGDRTTGQAVRSAFTRAVDIGNFGIVEFTHDDSPYLNTIVRVSEKVYLHQVKRNGNSTADERTGSGPGRAADECTGKTTCTGTVEKGAHRTFTLDFDNFIHGQFTHNRSAEIGTRPVCMGSWPASYAEG
ncbi:hypothetical protein [Stenotrophomonas maltophilia]|uniref:hypothetical protein n=1 Tax=Stenotrophomonas maltophilia TaxID=40324 RepID=UPI003D18EAF0